jgi:hypothetical protein
MIANGEVQQAAPKILIGFVGQHRQYLFEPAEDVTTAELSEALVLIYMSIPVMAGAAPPIAVDRIYDGLADTAKRHFKTRAKPSIVVPK